MDQMIGLDTCVFIYALEESPEYSERAERVLASIEQADVYGVFSVVGLVEVLTGSKQRGRFDLARRYKDLIIHFPHLAIQGMNEHIIKLASDLRAKYNIGTPDAIHVATAIDAGATAFITNDKSLKKVKEIKIQLL